MVLGTVGTMCGVVAFAVGVSKFLTFIASYWFLDVLADYNMGGCDE